MFSRHDRDNLVQVLNRYLSEELTAFKLGEALSEIGTKTGDETVKHVTDMFWCHYDDVEDHKVVASREEWDYFQRLLLILQSDAVIVQETGKRNWKPRQAVAAICLVLFGFAVAKTGFGYHILVVAVPLGIVSILLRIGDPVSRCGDCMSKPPLYPSVPYPSCARCDATSPISSKRGIPPSLAPGRFAAPSVQV